MEVSILGIVETVAVRTCESRIVDQPVGVVASPAAVCGSLEQ
ncbi:MAG: hypothetical protein AAF328_11120 [Planctomycetota bacterium]